MFFKRQKLLILKLRISEYKNRYFLILHILVNNIIEHNKEVYKGGRSMDKIRKEQMVLLRNGLIAIVLSIIGFVVFHMKGLYLVHPTLYIFTFIMGLGWSSTAVYSIRSTKKALLFSPINKNEL